MRVIAVFILGIICLACGTMDYPELASGDWMKYIFFLSAVLILVAGWMLLRPERAPGKKE